MGSAGNVLTGLIGDTIGLGGAFGVIGLAQLLVLTTLRWIPGAVLTDKPLPISVKRAVL